MEFVRIKDYQYDGNGYGYRIVLGETTDVLFIHETASDRVGVITDMKHVDVNDVGPDMFQAIVDQFEHGVEGYAVIDIMKQVH